MKTYSREDDLLVERVGRFAGAHLGRISSIDEEGKVFVDFPGNERGPIPARFTESMNISKLRRVSEEGRSVLLVFENSDPGLPIIVDLMSSLLDEVAQSVKPIEALIEKPDDVLLDGRRITFSAREEIVLRCGNASITLTKAGKILIKGAYLLNHSSGVNRIKGGSVQIN